MHPRRWKVRVHGLSWWGLRRVGVVGIVPKGTVFSAAVLVMIRTCLLLLEGKGERATL